MTKVISQILKRVALRHVLLLLAVGALSPEAFAVGTAAGTDITNTATVSYEVGGNPVTEDSPPVVVTVAEIIDVDVTVQTPQVPVAPGAANQATLFTVTNTGNGTETFSLAALSTLPGDDFDPVLSSPDSLFFDTDGSGDLSPGDQAYIPGTNDPVLPADGSVSIIVVNDIPAGLLDGNLGDTQLTATSTTGTGVAGTVIPGAGDMGVDALIGTSEGDDLATAEYLVETINLTVDKTAIVTDPFGGTAVVPGSIVVYTITTTLTGAGSATAVVVDDLIPTNTTYQAGSLQLNGAALTDAADADAGEFVTATPAITVALGDLTDADGPQVVEFTVVID